MEPEELANVLNAAAAQKPLGRYLQAAYDALTDEARAMVRAIVEDTLP